MNKEKNIFEMAARCKYRFPYRGNISVEDLWDLPVKALDGIFKTLNAEVKQSQEESLLENKSPEDEVLANKIAIIRHIVAVKQEEASALKDLREKSAKKQKILELMEKKDNEALEQMSKEDLQKMLENL